MKPGAQCRVVVTKTNKQAHNGSAEMPFKLYNTNETADILGIGRSIRFSAQDIADFVERNRVRAIGWKERK